jgi:large subunit ribosomal protein L29
MQIADVRTKSDDELKQALQELSKEALNLRFKKANGQLENLVRGRLLRREVARIKTTLRERSLGLTTVSAKVATKAPAKKAAKKKAS